MLVASILARKLGKSLVSSGLGRSSIVGFRTCAPVSSALVKDHGQMWNLERVVSALQVPTFLIPFAYTTPMTDAVFCTFAVLHSHWGLEAIVVDYLRPSLFGGNKTIPRICQGAVWLISAGILGGLLYFNYTDIGLVNTIKMLWNL